MRSLLKKLILGQLIALFGTVAVMPALLLGWFVAASASDPAAATAFRIVVAVDLVVLATIAFSLLFSLAVWAASQQPPDDGS